MKKRYFPLIILLFFGVCGYALGQSALTGIGGTESNGNAVSLSVSPEHPNPNQKVTIKALSFQVNLDNTIISWSVDGVVKLSGMGKKEFSFTTGSVGKSSKIVVSMNPADFGQITKGITITPADMDVLWEADTYIPPFYKGKALPSSQSSVRVIPFTSFSGKEGYYNSADLVYKWKKGYFGDAANSGYGKNIFVFNTGYTFNTDDIEVVASTLETGISVKKIASVYIYNPKITFYENKPLQGVRYENSLENSFLFSNKEFVVHAVPYFFSLDGINNNTAAYNWKLDGKKLEINPDNKNEFTFQKPSEGSGSFRLSLDIDNTGYDLQSSTKSLSIMYSN